MLEVMNLGCVRGHRTLFSDVNFIIKPGTLLQLKGPNGSGKTSLLRIVCGLMAPETGEVRWEGAKIRSAGEEYSRNLTYLGHRNGIKEELSSLENLRIAAGLAGFDLSREKAQEALKQVGLSGRENLPARFLSEGQRRRSALARLVACTTKLWVLDEVLASLDTAAVKLVESLIAGHLSNGGLVIVATHHDLNLPAGSFQHLELATGFPGVAPSMEQPS
jgi:heme exporter protein A